MPTDTTTHHDRACNFSAPHLFSAMEWVKGTAEKSLCYSNYTVSIFLPRSFNVKAKRCGRENNFCHSKCPGPRQRHEDWQINQEFTDSQVHPWYFIVKVYVSTFLSAFNVLLNFLTVRKLLLWLNCRKAFSKCLWTCAWGYIYYIYKNQINSEGLPLNKMFHCKYLMLIGRSPWYI